MDAIIGDDPLLETRAAYLEGKYKLGVAKATEAIKKYPHSYAAWILRGACLLNLNSTYSAILNFTKAITLNSSIYDAWNNRGCGFFRLCMWEEAIRDFEQSIALCPTAYMSHFQMGLLYSTTQRPVEAEYHFRAALARCEESDNNYDIISMFLATLLLGHANWKEGFKLDQRRYNIDRLVKKWKCPTWQGEDLVGKSILLHTEAGWGDKIQSLRYVDMLQKKYPGVKITFGTQKELNRLLASSFDLPITNVTGVETDYAVSLLDVPMVLKMSWDEAPRPEKYLKVEPQLVDKWKDKFRALPKGVNVGLCWASFNGISKFIPAWDMVELSGVPLVNFISLQVPYKQAPKELKLHDWTGEVTDWADTGAIIENCDLIISIDTGVAHMAGALGKPVWNIVRFSTYWPWLAPHIPPSPEYSIWYPSMTLFRQKAYGDWLEPVRKVTLELQRQLVGLT